MTVDNIAGPAGVVPSQCAPGGVWTKAGVQRELERALALIASAPIEREPFEHFSVHGLFSECFYADLVREVPPKSQFTEAYYPGTQSRVGCYLLPTELGKAPPIASASPIIVPHHCCIPKRGHSMKSEYCLQHTCRSQTLQLHTNRSRAGWMIPLPALVARARSMPLWVQLFRLVHSANFTRLLVDKFMLPDGGGVPWWKREHLLKTGGVRSLKNAAALRIEPEYYHLAPHVDKWEKIVTWQFFHPPTDALATRRAGTFFYRPLPELANKFVVDDQANPLWLNYSYFEAVKELRVMRNTFFAFAPNSRSWHGASIDGAQLRGAPPDSRRTFLGFVTRQEDGFWHFTKKDQSQEEAFYV